MTRQAWPAEVVNAVLVQSRRRCAYCFGLSGDTGAKAGQIAHIDRNPANSARENAAWLCLKHHSQYDSHAKQAKGHTPDELRHYQTQLYKFLASSQALGRTRRNSRAGRKGVSLEVYDRRLPIYRATVAFLREVLKLHLADQAELVRFATATEEALFLFDDRVAQYLSELYKQGLRLYAICLTIGEPGRRTRELVDEETRLVAWFSDQFAEARQRLVSYLRVE